MGFGWVSRGPSAHDKKKHRMKKNPGMESSQQQQQMVVVEQLVAVNPYNPDLKNYVNEQADMCLSEDLICEIFERLPLKHLIRFLCLSKSWYSRIASPSFIHKHYLRSCSRKVLIRHYDNGSKDLYALHSEDRFPLCQKERPGRFDISTLEFPYNNNHLKITNSCNGILCLHDYKNKNGGIIAIWNPSIRRKLALPDPPRSTGGVTVQGILGSRVIVGLGFDPVTDDYKIVRLSYFVCEGSVESSLVYSMKTRTWSSVAPPDPPFDHIKSSACFVNGALHWVVECFNGAPYYYIMTFNLSTLVFGKIMLPEHTWITRKPTVINGCLAVVSYRREADSWVWVMKEFNNVASWYVHFKVITHPFDGSMKCAMQLSTNGYFLISYYPHGFEVYNPSTAERFELFETKFLKVYMETCLETLELLDTRDLAS